MKKYKRKVRYFAASRHPDSDRFDALKDNLTGKGVHYSSSLDDLLKYLEKYASNIMCYENVGQISIVRETAIDNEGHISITQEKIMDYAYTDNSNDLYCYDTVYFIAKKERGMNVVQEDSFKLHLVN